MCPPQSQSYMSVGRTLGSGKTVVFVSESRLEQNPSLVQLQRTEESPEVPFIKEL